MAQHEAAETGDASRAVSIPDKLYFRIGEVARLCGVAPSVLRFWESEFPQLRPHKGGTGQRLFRRSDVETALRIRALLYRQGYTIPGARQLLGGRPRGSATQLHLAIEPAAAPPPEADLPANRRALAQLRSELTELQAMLSRPVRSQVPRSRGPGDTLTENLFDFRAPAPELE